MLVNEKNETTTNQLCACYETQKIPLSVFFGANVHKICPLLKAGPF